MQYLGVKQLQKTMLKADFTISDTEKQRMNVQDTQIRS